MLWVEVVELVLRLGVVVGVGRDTVGHVAGERVGHLGGVHSAHGGRHVAWPFAAHEGVRAVAVGRRFAGGSPGLRDGYGLVVWPLDSWRRGDRVRRLIQRIRGEVSAGVVVVGTGLEEAGHLVAGPISKLARARWAGGYSLLLLVLDRASQRARSYRPVAVWSVEECYMLWLQ